MSFIWLGEKISVKYLLFGVGNRLSAPPMSKRCRNHLCPNWLTWKIEGLRTAPQIKQIKIGKKQSEPEASKHVPKFIIQRLDICFLGCVKRIGMGLHLGLSLCSSRLSLTSDCSRLVLTYLFYNFSSWINLDKFTWWKFNPHAVWILNCQWFNLQNAKLAHF